MKNIIAVLMIVSFLSSSAQAFSVFAVKKEGTKKGPVKSFIEQKRLEREQENAVKNDINEIKNVLKCLTEYSNEHNVEKVLTLYDKSYRSFDGFNYETFTKMLKETFEAYDNLTYESDIQGINLYKDKAVVTLVDTTHATLSSPKAKKNADENSDMSTGYLEGECNYAIYLQKINGCWKIIGDNVISEITSIKYGSAREYPMEFTAPMNAPYDSDYCLTLKMTPKKHTKVVASLGKEEILYPSAEPRDVFRKLPKDGILERVVHSNENGFNEYAIASVGITKMDVAQDLSVIEFQMTGLAFLMQRVNLYKDINPLREVKKDKENTLKDTDKAKDKSEPEKEDKKDNVKNKG